MRPSKMAGTAAAQEGRQAKLVRLLRPLASQCRIRFWLDGLAGDRAALGALRTAPRQSTPQSDPVRTSSTISAASMERQMLTKS